MPITHVNRKGDTWHLFEGKTKSGKPKFYVSKKASSAGQEHFFVEIEGDTLVVYWRNQDSHSIDRISEVMYGDRLIGRSRVQAHFLMHGTYKPRFRFTLVDEDERMYATERMCSAEGRNIGGN